MESSDRNARTSAWTRHRDRSRGRGPHGRPAGAGSRERSWLSGTGLAVGGWRLVELALLDPDRHHDRHGRPARRSLGDAARGRRVVTGDPGRQGRRHLPDGRGQRVRDRWQDRRDPLALAAGQRRSGHGPVMAGRRSGRGTGVRRAAERAGGGAPPGHRRAGLGRVGRQRSATSGRAGHHGADPRRGQGLRRRRERR